MRKKATGALPDALAIWTSGNSHSLFGLHRGPVRDTVSMIDPYMTSLARFKCVNGTTWARLSTLEPEQENSDPLM